MDPMILKGDDSFLLHLSYTVPDGILVKDGTVTYAPIYNSIVFDQVSNDLCDLIQCPIHPGSYTNNSMNKWPWGMYEAFSSEITWRDANHTLLLCMSITGNTWL